MRNYLGVSANAPEAQVRARLAELTERTLGDRATEVIPYVEHLLSLKPSSATAAARISQLDADQLRQQIFIAVRDLFVAESERICSRQKTTDNMMNKRNESTKKLYI